MTMYLFKISYPDVTFFSDSKIFHSCAYGIKKNNNNPPSRIKTINIFIWVCKMFNYKSKIYKALCTLYYTNIKILYYVT